MLVVLRCTPIPRECIDCSLYCGLFLASFAFCNLPETGAKPADLFPIAPAPPFVTPRLPVGVEVPERAPRRTAAAKARLSRCSPLREEELEALVNSAAERHDVGAGLLKAIVRRESAGSPCAVSKTGARGIMQLMPSTARALGVTDITDPHQNLDAGVRYLKQQLKRYNNDLKLALAAYNAGPGAIDEYGGIPPFPETQKYVRLIIQNLQE